MTVDGEHHGDGLELECMMKNEQEQENALGIALQDNQLNTQ